MADPDARCVYCRRKPIAARWRPFCSERCKMADLGRWLSEDYRVPDEGAATPAPADADDD